jgi:hypothetical protein
MALSWPKLSIAEPTVKQENSPSPIEFYLSAYNALEAATKRTQILIDTLHKAALVLSQFGAAGGRSDAWKRAEIEELEPLTDNRQTPLRWQISLAAMPTAHQLLDAIGDWREKRVKLEEQWNQLSAEAQAVLKAPESLD